MLIKKVINSCLSFLVAVIEPGLMDDPCDWDVCVEAATLVNLSKLSSGMEGKKHTKSAMDLAVKASRHTKPENTPSAPTPAVHGEETSRTVVASKDDRMQNPQQAGPTRKELQDALPKIPPLSSFKSCRPRFMTLEEAELDFHSFITTGLGRSVDVIREFGGQEDSQPSVHSESITLDDDSSECLKLCGKWRESYFSNPRSLYGSISSHCKKDDEERPSISEPQIEVPQVMVPPEPKVEPKHIKYEAPAPQKHPSNRETLPNPENDDPSVKHNRQGNQTVSKRSSRDESKKREKCGKQMKQVAKKGKREHWGRNKEEDDDEEEWSAEAYWRASYRAWNDYYASMSAFQSLGYQSCYGAAHSWMAAYRMNAVYMEELLKD